MKALKSNVVSIGLAIFSMLFGAGNLMYPLQVGMTAGTNYVIGLFGFILTAVMLPILGFMSMILFNGNYKNFFFRLGTSVGNIVIFVCMMIIGPLIAMPRIITLSHTMTAPFLPQFLATVSHSSSLLFALLFLSITFVLTYKENRIVDVLGYVISPLLLASLAIIIIKGILYPDAITPSSQSSWDIFITNLTRGYETLDLLGALFFSSMVLTILKNSLNKEMHDSPRALLPLAFKASIIGVSLLGVVYIGMGLLGAYHGSHLTVSNAGELFRAISFKVLGAQGAAIIATAVLMACLSTAIALAAVVAEYVQHELLKGALSYLSCLLLVLVSCIPLSVAGLTHVLQLTGGVITYVGYPVLIALTICNILYKLVGFKPVKIPVLLTFVITLMSYFNLVKY